MTNGELEEIKRQSSLITAMTDAIHDWTKDNGKITPDDLAHIVATYAFHIPKEKRLSLMFDIMIKTSMSR